MEEEQYVLWCPEIFCFRAFRRGGKQIGKDRIKTRAFDIDDDEDFDFGSAFVPAYVL